MSAPTSYHRLHPGTILISMVGAVRQFLLPIMFAAFSCVQGAKADGTQFGELFGAGIGLLLGLTAVFRYFSYGYAIHEGNLVIKEGIIRKSIRTIPLTRIQNINLKRGLIHRMMNLVDMEIETAGGSKAEASLSALTEDNAQRLKVLLTGEGHLAMSPVMAARQDPLIYSASPKELFLAGATHNRALTIIAGLFGTFFVFVQKQFETAVESLVKSSDVVSQMNVATRTVIGVVLLLIVGWVASIIMSFVNYWGFEVRKSEGKIKRTYGLINHIENVILIRRIQVVRMTQTLAQRILKLCSLHVDTAGGLAVANSGKEGERQAANPNSNLISPLLEEANVGGLIHVMLPDFHIQSPEWKQVSARTIIRHLRIGLAVNVLWAVIVGVGIQVVRMTDKQRDALASSLAAQAQTLALIAGGLYVLFCLLTWLRAYLYFRTARWWDQGDVFVSRTGVLSRTTWYAPVAKIQSVQISQTPGQRRLGLASLTFRTAAMHGTAAVEVMDVTESTAAEVAASLHRRSAEHAWANPDGF